MMPTNEQARWLISRNWRDEEWVAPANALLDICDSQRPPFRVEFGADRGSGFSGSSMDRARSVISIATEDEEDVRRTPDAMLISLAHEVGHVFDPPTAADQLLVAGTPEHHARRCAREEEAWK